jgi:mxaJ protein
MRAKSFFLNVLAVTACLGLVIPSAVAAKALRVCADPDYLPFSNRAGEGFENKVAETLAKALGEPVEYTWASYRGKGGFPSFVTSTLEAKKCDVLMDVPYASQIALTTQPYYISSYVFVYKRDKKYDIVSMDSPVLAHLRVGFERDTPAETALMMRGLTPTAVPFKVGDNDGESPAVMLKAVEGGQVDVMITWAPAIGGFLHDYADLEVVQVPNSRSKGAPEQYAFPMAMAVRKGDEELKKQLDEAIDLHKAELTAILDKSGVKLYEPPSPN